MLILTNSGTDKLQLTTSAAVTVDVHASWADNTSGTITFGRTNTAISTATTTDIVATPAASTVRNVRTLNIRNKHATASVDVTAIYNQNGTSFELHKATIRAGEVLEYVEGVGWYTIQSETALVRVAKLGSDQSNSTTTLTELTGMSLTTGTGTFFFRYMVLYQAAATTTGVRFSVNHTGTVSFFVANWHVVDNTATASTAAADQDAVASTAQVYSAYAARAKATTGWGTTISVDTANSDMLAVVEGLCGVTADGDIELWHGSEVAAASTVKAGSSLVLIRTGD